MATEVEVKKWGNSLGIVIPKALAARKHLRPHERVLIEVVKESDLEKVFGSLGRRMSGQKFKDMVREGW